MGFVGYLILGSVVYAIGFATHLKVLRPKCQQGIQFTLIHPIILGLLVGVL